jgi:hypothetical protein
MDNVLKHANRLRGKTHYVSRQMPPAQKERNQFAYPEFKELKDDPSKKARLTNGRLFVQGKEQIKYSLSVLPVIDPGHSMESSFSASDECDDEQNVFRGYASKVTSLTDISAVRQELLRDSKVSSSHHLIMAYRIKLDGGTLCENFDSDGDHGTGIELLKSMRRNEVINCVFFATRHCHPGHKHIGSRRFTHVNELCAKALEALHNQD